MEQPPKFMPDKELSKVGGSLWLYIIMQLTLSFLFSFVAMPLIMYSLYYDYSAINACIENVFVKHNVYGKLEAKMNISSRKQVKEFIVSISQNRAKPLTDLTSGYHCHTVSAQSKEDLDSIEESLRKLHILQEA